MHEKLQSLLLIRVIRNEREVEWDVLVRNFLVAVMEIQPELT